MNRKILTQPEHLRAINITNTHKKVILFSFFNRRSFPFNRRFDLKDNGQGSLFTPSLWLNSNFITIISNVDHLGGVSNEVSTLLSLSPSNRMIFQSSTREKVHYHRSQLFTNVWLRVSSTGYKRGNKSTNRNPSTIHQSNHNPPTGYVPSGNPIARRFAYTYESAISSDN